MNRQTAFRTWENTSLFPKTGLFKRTAIHSTPEKTERLSILADSSKESHFKHNFSRVPVQVDQAKPPLEPEMGQYNNASALQLNGKEQDTTTTNQPAPESVPATTPAETLETAPPENEIVADEANIKTPPDNTQGTVIRGDFPRVSPTEYWFFNGGTPSNYTVSSVLSTNRSGGVFNWSVTPHLTLSSTTSATPTVTTATASTVRDDAWIRVRHTDNTGTRTSTSYRVTVLSPDSLDHQSTTHSPRGTSFHTQVKYKILDQFGTMLPRDVPWNEDFNKDGLHAVAGVRDYPDARENWGWGPESGWVVPPNNAVDNISRGTPPGRFPRPMRPQSPLTNTKIDHIIGAWFVGSTTIGRGKLVKDNNKWQIYIDHGAHE